MVDVMRKIHVDFVGANVGVLGQVDTRKVLVLDEDGVMCRGQRGEGESILQVLTGRRMVEVYGVGLENVVAVGCRGVESFIELAGVERSVMVISNGERDGVGSR